ncbi:MAG: site-specific integrase [Candidatus Aureabacteria bacterium]|nr:site-specific integrase [Candidatus Auribacterota bacterium]
MALFRKNGNWYIDYRCDGVRIREKAGSSKKDAENALAMRKAAILQGKFDIKARRKRIQFKELANKYLEYSKATKRSHRRDGTSMKHLLQFFAGYRLNQINPHIIEQYKIERRREIMSLDKYRGRDSRDVPMATINRELACLSHMFNMAIKWEKAEHNPAKGVKFFKEENLTQRLLTNDQITALLANCTDYLKGIVTIALNTGMRLGEILNLTWGQVDLGQGYITVIKTKSGKQRKIPINRAAYDVLKNQHRDSIFVFNQDGKPFGSVKKGFKAALRRSGIGYCRFHDLRHTFATRLVLANVSLPVVKELLGHASIETTMRYAHPTPESKRSAVDMLDWQKTDLDGHFMDTKEFPAERQLVVTPCK